MQSDRPYPLCPKATKQYSGLPVINHSKLNQFMIIREVLIYSCVIPFKRGRKREEGRKREREGEIYRGRGMWKERDM